MNKDDLLKLLKPLDPEKIDRIRKLITDSSDKCMELEDKDFSAQDIAALLCDAHLQETMWFASRLGLPYEALLLMLEKTYTFVTKKKPNKSMADFLGADYFALDEKMTKTLSAMINEVNGQIPKKEAELPEVNMPEINVFYPASKDKN